jgi:hypothetical protein
MPTPICNDSVPRVHTLLQIDTTVQAKILLLFAYNRNQQEVNLMGLCRREFRLGARFR